MERTAQHSIELRKAIRAKYAWPGGYPMYLIMSDGEAVCMDCARKEYRLIARARHDNDTTGGWLAMGADINWEDTELHCAHCNAQIESAYGDPDDGA